MAGQLDPALLTGTVGNDPTVASNNGDDEQLPAPGEEVTESSIPNDLAECLSLEADALLLDGAFEGGLSGLLNEQKVSSAPAEGPKPVIQTETQPLPNPLFASSVPPVAGPISPPEQADAIEAAGLPAFTPLDEIVERATLTDPEIKGIFSDLHGITTGVDNLQVDDSKKRPPRSAILWRLEDELSKLPVEDTAAYRQAVIKCPGLVNDERKMAFLEREDGDPVLAAVRLALHWELRLDHFGPERCFLPMTLSGAMRGQADNMVRFPIHQLLPVKDTAGRAIWYMDTSRRDFESYSLEEELMAYWYLFEVASEDPEVLKHGLVVIMNWKDVERKHFSQNSSRFSSAAKRMKLIPEKAMPIRLRACHHCNQSAFVYYVLPILLYYFGRDLRQRTQLHRGSEAKLLQELAQFCLPKARLPAELGGEIVLDMASFLTARMSLENSRPDPRLVLDQKPISVPVGPAAKRVRSQSTPEEKEVTTTAHQNTPVNEQPKNLGGRPSDPRMAKAVDAKLGNPDLSLMDALQMGGFTFHTSTETGELVDNDNITVVQRKNQLCRRIRHKRDKLKKQPANITSTSTLTLTPASATTTDTAPVLESRDFFDDAISEIADLHEANLASVQWGDIFDDSLSEVADLDGSIPVPCHSNEDGQFPT